MALNKLKFNSLNVTPAAGEAIRFNSSANGLETASAGGSLVKIASTTASSSSTVSFTSGLTSTYKEYIFVYNNIHPGTDNTAFQVNFSIDSGSNYNVTKTSTAFTAAHKEDDATAFIQYESGDDLAQGTGFQNLSFPVGNDNDQSVSGTLHLFEPSNTTFVKHFISTCNACEKGDYTGNHHVAGYGNTTSAIDAVQFKLSSGTMDSGVIKLYGVS